MVVAMDSLPEGFMDSLVARIYKCVSSVNRVLTIEKKVKCCVCQALRGISVHASHACLHCSDNLCDKCAKGHNSSSLTHGHMVVPVSDIRRGKIQPEAERKSSCDVQGHGNQYYEFYCIRCSQSVCSMCLLAKHWGHHFELLGEIAKTRRKHISELAQSLQKLTSGLVPPLLGNINAMDTARNAAHSCSDIDSVSKRDVVELTNKIADIRMFVKAVSFLMSSVKAVDTASNNDILKFFSELNKCMEHITNSKQIIQKCAISIESELSRKSESSVGTAERGARPKKAVSIQDIHSEKETTSKRLTMYEEAQLGSGYSFRLTKCLTVVGKHGHDCINGSSYEYSNDPNFSYTGSCNPTGVFADVFLPPDGWLDAFSSSNSDSAEFLIECEHENDAVSHSQGHTPKDDTISSLNATGTSATETRSHSFPSSQRSDASEKGALGTQGDITTGKEILSENEGMQGSGPVPQVIISQQATRAKLHDLKPYRSQYIKEELSSRSEDPGTKMAASVCQTCTLESTRKTEHSSRSEDPGTKMAASVRKKLTLESTRKIKDSSRSEDPGNQMADSVRKKLTLESTRKTDHSSRYEDTGTKMAASVRQTCTLESTRKTEHSARSEDPGTKMAVSVRQTCTLESTRKTEHSSRPEDPGTKMAASARQTCTLESTRKTEHSSRSEDPGTKMASSVRKKLTLESTRKTEHSSRSEDPGTKMASSVRKKLTLESTRKTDHSSRSEDPGTKMAASVRQTCTLESTRKTKHSSRSEDPGTKMAANLRQNLESKRRSDRDLTMTEFLGNVVNSIYNWYVF